MAVRLREMISCMADDNFHVLDVENLRPHYNRTLLCWEHNFRAVSYTHLPEKRKVGACASLRIWMRYPGIY